MADENNNSGLETDGTLTSTSLAELIIDALIHANFIRRDDFEEAVRITALEIDVRKGAGDY